MIGLLYAVDVKVIVGVLYMIDIPSEVWGLLSPVVGLIILAIGRMALRSAVRILHEDKTVVLAALTAAEAHRDEQATEIKADLLAYQKGSEIRQIEIRNDLARINGNLSEAQKSIAMLQGTVYGIDALKMTKKLEETT